MKTILITATIIFILFFFITKFRKNLLDNKWPFYAHKVLSTPEKILYFRLLNSLPDQIILSQVCLSRIIGVTKGNNFNRWNNRINRMTVDFVICNKDFKILTIIELDDKSHLEPTRIIADAKKNKALLDAGITLIRWNVKNLPNEETIKKELNDLF